MNISKVSNLLCLVLGFIVLFGSTRFALAAATCQAGASPNHTNCTAHGINAPVPQVATGGTLWEGHTIAFSLGAITDVDHCCDGQDYAEDKFDVTWYVQHFINGDWAVLKGLSNSSNTAAYWSTSNYSAGEPASVAQYRIMVRINDTPDLGDAKANDTQVDKFSSSFTLRAPTITNHHQVGAAAVDTVFTGFDAAGNGNWQTVDGALSFNYHWDASCWDGTGGESGREEHLAHLDNVTHRERVGYDGTDSPHNTAHPTGDKNIFTSEISNPTRRGGSATGGLMIDSHSPYAIGSGRWTSFCKALQKYQQAYAYDTRPGHLSDTISAPWPGWSDLETHEIKRYAELSGGNWRYRITKSGEQSTWYLP